VKVDTVELLGAERLVYGHVAGEPLIVRIEEGAAFAAAGPR
jgi:sn-glycerol 3-phosphate transport system ATP-binding protein